MPLSANMMTSVPQRRKANTRKYIAYWCGCHFSSLYPDLAYRSEFISDGTTTVTIFHAVINSPSNALFWSSPRRNLSPFNASLWDSLQFSNLILESLKIERRLPNSQSNSTCPCKVAIIYPTAYANSDILFHVPASLNYFRFCVS